MPRASLKRLPRDTEPRILWVDLSAANPYGPRPPMGPDGMVRCHLERFTKPCEIPIMTQVVLIPRIFRSRSSLEGLSRRVPTPYRRGRRPRRGLGARRRRPLPRLGPLCRQLPAPARPHRLASTTPQPRRPPPGHPAAPLRRAATPARAGAGPHPGPDPRPPAPGVLAGRRLPAPAKARPAPQKKTRRAAEQQRPDVQAQRQDWAEWQTQLTEADLHRLVFWDETWLITAMTPLYGRAPAGQRVVEYVPHGRWERLTL